MQFTTTILAAALSLAAGTQAWAQDGNGVYVANNNVHRIAEVNAHESCTRMNSEVILTSGSCTYWTDAIGGQYSGDCVQFPGNVVCI